MPILDIEIVLRPNELLSSDLAGEIANRAGSIFGTPASQTWVKVREIRSEHYAENDSGSQDALFPVFVHILKARLPAPKDLQPEVDAITAAIAEVCQRPLANVHLFYQPEAAGRVAFGGHIVSE